MKGFGWFVAVIGVIVLILGVARHFNKFFLPSVAHASLILAGVGVVLLLVGAGMAISGGKSS